MSLIEVKVPQLSESVSEATLLQWKKKPGRRSSRTRSWSRSRPTRSSSKSRRPASGVLAQVIKDDGDSCHRRRGDRQGRYRGPGSGLRGDADQEHPRCRAGTGRKARRSRRRRRARRGQERSCDACRRQADGRARPAGRVGARDGQGRPGDQGRRAGGARCVCRRGGTDREGRCAGARAPGGACARAGTRTRDVRAGSPAAAAGSCAAVGAARRPPRAARADVAGCARASPSGCCSRRRPTRSSPRSTK